MPKLFKRILPGFSLIELMVVVSLFGISASLITASYLTFERNQRVKNSAVLVRDSIRLVQNKASSGDKGPQIALDSVCPKASTLAGWYLKVDSAAGSNTTFTIGGDCLLGIGETAFSDVSGTPRQIVNLPPDTKINRIITNACGNPTAAVFFFRPLKNNVLFHSAAAVPSSGSSVDFLDNSSATTPVNTLTCSTITVELSNSAGARTNQIVIQPSGEVQ